MPEVKFHMRGLAMINLFDKNSEIMAVVFSANELTEPGKFFLTKPGESMQVAVMSHRKSSTINRHYHPPQERNIDLTAEVIIVLNGKLRLRIFELDGTPVWDGILISNSVALLLRGGHAFEALADCKFIEVKQGPFDSLKDKIHY